MQNFLKTRTLWLSVAGISTIAFASYFFLKDKVVKADSLMPDPAFAEYVSAFTTGIVSSESTVKILLTNDYKTNYDPESDKPTQLFKFDPAIEGEAKWINKRTIEFVPSAKMKSGEVYRVAFALEKVAEIKEAKFKEMDFGFKVMPQYFEVEAAGLSAPSSKSFDAYEYKGKVFTADVASGEQVEKILKATLPNQTLSVVWVHAADKHEHTFTIKGIKRTKESPTMTLAWDGDALEVDNSFEEEIKIPALEVFEVISSKVIQSPDQYVSVRFSDPLDENQSFEGLATLSTLRDLKYSVFTNELRIYPTLRQNGESALTISAGIKNGKGKSLPKSYTANLVFEELKPAFRLVGTGVVLPTNQGIVFPFEAVNLKSVEVKVIKIFESNVAQFLQMNDLNGDQEMVRVGRPIFRKTIVLQQAGVANLNKWNRFTLDLTEMVKTEPGAIYQVVLSFRKRNIAYTCTGVEDESADTQWSREEEENAKENETYDNGGYEYSYWNYYEEYGEEYDYSSRDNPCNPAYYSSGANRLTRNILSSDLGLIAKRGNAGGIFVAVTNIQSASPISDVEVDILDYQQQVIASGKTDKNGFVNIQSSRKPFLIIAKNGKQRGYLKVSDANALSLSNFDVAGVEVQRGTKGFIYGERGIWRPGDTLFLSFILEDKQKLIPENHPVVLELSNPEGAVVKRMIKYSSVKGIYSFYVPTDEDAPTGNWLATVKLGGATFTKGIKIEAIKPNRLKMDLDFGKQRILATDGGLNGKLFSRWLHGAKASKLRATCEVTLNAGKTLFKGYEGYAFDDQGVSFTPETRDIFEGQLDNEGYAFVNASLDIQSQAPGALNAIFKAKVFEESGDFSYTTFSIPYYPYNSFVGVQLPKGDVARGMLLTDKDHKVQIQTLEANGTPISRNNLRFEVYKLSWRWWWDKSEGGAGFMQNENLVPLYQETVSTGNDGKGTGTLRVNYPEWGRFYVKVTDPVSGHSTGQVLYLDWPGWAGKGQRENPGGATMLSLSTDKEAYQVGDKMQVVFPSDEKTKALISIENGLGIVQSMWVDGQKDKTTVEIDVTEQMAPNVFVHVSLLQPYVGKTNDLPLRMYGLISVQVENKNTHLEPVIVMPEVLRPNELVKLKISEKSNKPMAYTVAIVDEGLLDINRFKTPDPYSYFYAKEALGVKTWDIFDEVFGGYGGTLERLLSIGGDMEIKPASDKGNSLRFKPVVKVLGPFFLEKGEQDLQFMMPNYIGSVRVMAVAAYQGSYGSSEKAVPVKQSLMLLATLPRVVAPEEEILLPVNVFAADNQAKNVNISVSLGKGLSLIGPASQNISFKQPGDQLVYFKFKAQSQLAYQKVKIKAVSGSLSATQEIDLLVRNANPWAIDVKEMAIEPGKNWTLPIAALGLNGTNSYSVELSSLPPINLEKRIDYLIQYPHGCLEQTVSSVFPQLYLSSFVEMDEKRKAQIQQNINSGIAALAKFQSAGGGFTYWPSTIDINYWAHTYACHFLLEAKENGYSVPESQIKSALGYIENRYQDLEGNGSEQNLAQAYGLYLLALGKRPSLSLMNRLKEKPLSAAAKWRLAAAYALAGQTETANSLVTNLDFNFEPYTSDGYTFGSDTRDLAMALEALSILGNKTQAYQALKLVAEKLSTNQWMSTQSTAYSLLAVFKYVGQFKAGSGIDATYAIGNGKAIQAKTGLAFASMALPSTSAGQALTITNKQKSVLFARFVSKGLPAAGNEVEVQNNLNLQVKYFDGSGNPVNVANLEPGKSFTAEATVTNPSNSDYKQMALSQIFPSGWEIQNDRLADESVATNSGWDYQDIRDDRVLTYFTLKKEQSLRVKTKLIATYQGKFYLPGVLCEAMYNGNIQARNKGMWVNVVKGSVLP